MIPDWLNDLDAGAPMCDITTQTRPLSPVASGGRLSPLIFHITLTVDVEAARADSPLTGGGGHTFFMGVYMYFNERG